MTLSVIVAYTGDSQGRKIIGKDGLIPWKITKDMLWFKEHTLHNVIIMGRKTHESIGRVLPGRMNIIISRQKDYAVEGAHVFNDLSKAIKFAQQNNSEVFIIGGAEIYKQTIGIVDRIYETTLINNPGYEGDTFFPEWKRSEFKSIHLEEFQDSENGKIIFQIYQRSEYKESSLVELLAGRANKGGDI